MSNNITITYNVKNVTVTNPADGSNTVTVSRDANNVVVKDGRGLRGQQGDSGLSAYELWLADGNTGTLQDFFLATGSLQEIDDSQIALNTTYSSTRIEERLDEDVGDALGANFVQTFEGIVL